MPTELVTELAHYRLRGGPLHIITRFRGAAGVFEHSTATNTATDHLGSRERVSLAAFLRGCNLQREMHRTARLRCSVSQEIVDNEDQPDGGADCLP